MSYTTTNNDNEQDMERSVSPQNVSPLDLKQIHTQAVEMRKSANSMQKEAEKMKLEGAMMRQEVAKMRQGRRSDSDSDRESNNTQTKQRVPFRTKQQEKDEERAEREEEANKSKEVIKEQVKEKEKVEEEQGEAKDAAKFTAMARRQYQNRIKNFSHKDHKCQRCWLIKECCVCHKIAPVSTKHEYIIYMHQLEYLRGSNTGKILLMADPKTKLYISGQDTEKELFELLQSRPANRVMCLMPKDSVSIEEFVANAFKDPEHGHVLHKAQVDSQHDGLDYLDSVEFFDPESHATTTQTQTSHPTPTITSTSSSSSALSPSSPSPSSSPSLSFIPAVPPVTELPVVTVVVLDGTWKQVKALLNRLPDITKVHLPIEPDGIKSLLTPVRQQSTPDRICTLQAAIIAMEHLGESPALCESLIKSLKHFMNSLLRQGGRKIAYDENDEEHNLQEITKKVKGT